MSVKHPRIIGLNGVARAGKDTVAAVLRDVYGYRIFEQGGASGFSAVLNQCLVALNPWVPSSIQDYGRVAPGARYADLVKEVGYEAAKEIPEVRRLLQAMGTEVGRDILGPDIWVDAMFSQIGRDKVVITNVRFPNEFWATKEHGGEVWRVNRPGFEASNDHVSDTALDKHDFDAVIENDGTVSDLASKVVDLMDGPLQRSFDRGIREGL